MMEASSKFQRRTVLVKRGLQLKYAVIVFAGVVFTAMIVGGDIYYTMLKLIERENPGMVPVVAQVMRLNTIKILIFLGIMFLVSLFVSHRFAGPIYRFERSAQAIASGDLTHRVSLRTGDDLVELQDEMNSMVSSLQRLVQKDRNLTEHLASRIDTALKKIRDNGTSEQLMEELQSIRAEIHHLTRGFKV